MRYSLWSRGRLVGRTDLDVHTISASMRQGFIEPTPEGLELLSDATGVPRALAESRRGQRARGGRVDSDLALIQQAIDRREALAFELRDESGAIFEFDFIRVYDNFDERAVDEMCATAEEEEAEFEAHLSSLSGAAREEAIARRRQMEADVEADVQQILAERDEQEERGWGSTPEDARWDTMQYFIQVHLKHSHEPFDL